MTFFTPHFFSDDYFRYLVSMSTESQEPVVERVIGGSHFSAEFPAGGQPRARARQQPWTYQPIEQPRRRKPKRPHLAEPEKLVPGWLIQAKIEDERMVLELDEWVA